jgi:NAD(P)-dependent dehydrogenase (short-subunit alcohol dehydrogenase family)
MGNIIVAGGAGELGRAVVQGLHERGHRLATIDLAPASPTGLEPLAIGNIDLTDLDGVAAACAKIEEKLGPINGLVNVAGGFVWQTLADGDIGQWEKMFRINVLTAAVSSKAALPHLARTRGAIVNVGAAAARQPGVGMGAYAASKAGVLALTESLANEARKSGVRVNAVLPTIIDTLRNRQDMPKADPANWIAPSAIANVIGFLLGTDAAAINGQGVVLSVD